MVFKLEIVYGFTFFSVFFEDNVSSFFVIVFPSFNESFVFYEKKRKKGMCVWLRI